MEYWNLLQLLGLRNAITGIVAVWTAIEQNYSLTVSTNNPPVQYKQLAGPFFATFIFECCNISGIEVL